MAEAELGGDDDAVGLVRIDRRTADGTDAEVLESRLEQVHPVDPALHPGLDDVRGRAGRRHGPAQVLAHDPGVAGPDVAHDPQPPRWRGAGPVTGQIAVMGE